MNEPIWISVITIIALLLGPVLAVWVSAINDERRSKYARRMDVFRNLMRTRKLPMSTEYVAALNMVEIEFYGESNVIAAWRDYQIFLNTRNTENPDKVDWQAWQKKRSELLTRLLHAMATTLKYEKIQQLDIYDGGYVPQGWADNETQNQRLRSLLIEMLDGNRPLPVTNF